MLKRFINPLELSTLNGINGFTINGVSASDTSGLSLADAGDVNGDGISDVIIGAPGADPGGRNLAGTSYVVFGSRTAFGPVLELSSLNGTNGFTINGVSAGDESGSAVANAGDINDDNITDLIIGAYIASPPGRSSAGVSYVVFGRRTAFGPVLELSSLNGTNGFTINGVSVGDRSGYSVATAGDLNGDNIADLIIGAYMANPSGRSGAGTSYVVFGSRAAFGSVLELSSLNGTNGFAINGISSVDYSGYSVAAAGDLNGDGIRDVIIAAYGVDPGGRSNAGASYVVFGSHTAFGPVLELSSLNGTNGFAINGISAGDRSGSSVANAGDLNGDGISDVIIGADSADPGGRNDAGVSYVIFGSRNAFSPVLELSSLNGTNGFTINGVSVGDRSGAAVATGSLNGDNITDVIIGAVGADPGGRNLAGTSYVVFGSRIAFGSVLELSNLNGTNGFAMNGISAGDYSGSSVAAADFNGDNITDVIIGAAYASPGGRNGAGASYVVFGGSTLLMLPPPFSTQSPTSITSSYNPTISSTSKRFINPVELSTLNGANGFTINGVSIDDASGGYSVAAAGDVNGDGVSDVIIGAYGVDPSGRSNAGASYVIFGSHTGFNPALELSGLNGNNGFAINGASAGDESGYSVAAAGDINGDGISDVIIGTNNADPGGRSAAGASYVVFGSHVGFNPVVELSSLSGTNGFAINGIAASDASGRSVSAAGDVNGDGISDVIIGASQVDPGGRVDAGASYVIFGSRTVFSSALELSSLNGTNGFAINGVSADDTSGWSVAAAGDFNGDNITDVIIGAPTAVPGGRNRAGASYVVFGSRMGFNATLELSSLNGTNGFVINGISAYDYSGYSVAAAGDLNGDNITDVVIGAHNADPGGRCNAGASYVVFGSRVRFSPVLELSSLNGTNGFAINGISAGDASGWSVAAAGDLNGDGISDVIIGAKNADPGGRSAAGASYVVFGSRMSFNATLELSSLDSTNGFTIHGVSTGDISGWSVAAAGDLNGDNISDVIIGACGADPHGKSGAGVSYVVFGESTLLAPSSLTFFPTKIPTMVPSRAPIQIPVQPSSGNTQTDSSISGILGGSIGGLVAVLVGIGALYRYCSKGRRGHPTRSQMQLGENGDKTKLSRSPASKRAEQPDNIQQATVSENQLSLEMLSKPTVNKPAENKVASDKIESTHAPLSSSPRSFNRASPELKFSFEINYAELQLDRTDMLGVGGFGTVYKARYRNNPVAVKELKVGNPSLDSLKEFQKEMNIMANLRCPQVVQFYGVYFTPMPGIVMEYMSKGSLYQVIHSGQPALSWSIRLKIARDIVCGLSFLHNEHIIHRDLKSLNVLLNEHMQAKLTDFGLAKIKTETMSFSNEKSSGTLLWMAPELFKRGAVCTSASDVYSLGLTLWELAAYKRPFQDAQNDAIAKGWIEQGEREPIPRDCPPVLARAITWCWDGAAANRPQAQQVLALLDGRLNDQLNSNAANESYASYRGNLDSGL